MPQRILVTGSSGLVGQALCAALEQQGHRLTRLRRGQGAGTWDPSANRIDARSLEDHDAAVHLAGENIAAGRWTAAQKARIRDSRVHGTQLLAGALANLAHKPRVLVCASAIGFYGCRGDETLDEQSTSGSNFLAQVCQEWEAAAAPAQRAGIRVVFLRLGMVLSPKGGALAKMLTPFKLGAGGIIGDGKQYWSWVSLDDVVGVAQFALQNQSLSGPVNTVSPEPATCRSFTRTLGGVLHRPTIAPMPAFAARLAFGQMADELLLCSAKVEPAVLKQAGYAFQHPTLQSALSALL
jgi:uncharacterized protein (TIGR01777 family)